MSSTLTPESAQAQQRLLEIITALVAETHPGMVARVTLDSQLERDLGLDSLGRVELLLRIGEAFSTTLPEEALNEAQSARELLRYLSLGAGVGASVAPLTAATALPEAGETALPVVAQTLTEVLDWHAARQPDRVHVLLYSDGEQSEPITYAQLRDEARSIAAGLLSRNLQPQQAVALMLPTGREYLASFFGVLYAGGIPVPIYPPARLSQIDEHLKRHARILNNAGAVLIITVPQAKPVALMLRSACPALLEIVTPPELTQPPITIGHRITAQDIAFLQYTSGSTGDPKGVTLTHANLLANVRAMGVAVQATSADVFVSWLPLYHDMGLIGAWLGSLYYAMPLVLMSPLTFLARPQRWLQLIHRHRGTLSAGPNFAYELCARKLRDAQLAGLDLSSWRLAFNGAEPVSPATLEAFATRFVPYGFKREALAPVYGLAESSVGLGFPPLGRGPLIDRIERRAFAESRQAVPVAQSAARADEDAMLIPACGRALPDHAMRIVDDDDRELPERRIGHLQFRGPSTTRGYYRNPEATQRLLHGEWLDSGDYGYLVDGEIYLTGRAKDLIIRGGRNIYPYELEQAVGDLAGVRKGCVAVFGVPDPLTHSERLVVIAETRERGEDTLAALRERINAAAVDVIGMPVDDIVLAPPHTVLKTSSGKIRRAASRELYERGEIGKAAPPVWLQMARLALPALRLRLRDGLRRGAALLYGGYVWLLFGLLTAIVWSIVAALQRPRAAHYVTHFAARLLLRLIGMPCAVAGIEHLPERPHLLAVNHASYFDTIVLTAVLPPRLGYTYIAKRELAGHWFSRLFLTGIGVRFVERTDARRGAEDVAQIAADLRAGENVVVFPEGTFSRETGLRRFRMGAFVAAAQSGVPIVVAGLRGVRNVLRDQTWLPRRGKIEFEIGAPLIPTGNDWSSAIGLRDATRAEMLRLCGEPDLTPPL